MNKTSKSRKRTSSKRSKSSRIWLDRQHSDPFTEQAKKLGYRSRAAFKLLEIQERDKIFQSGMTIIDLGAAPGSWSQVASQLIGKKGQIIALDCLPMDPLIGVDIIIGDFQEQEVFDQLMSRMANEKADIVLSDMAPNISGIRTSDQSKAYYLAELALEAATLVLKIGGTFLVKVFQGEGFEEYSTMLKRQFKQIVVRKPKSSRAESREIYLLAKGFLGHNKN